MIPWWLALVGMATMHFLGYLHGQKDFRTRIMSWLRITMGPGQTTVRVSDLLEQIGR